MMKRYHLLALTALLTVSCRSEAPDLQLSDLGCFERQGVNVLVFSNPFNGGFNDEKNSGIEVIHHGVRRSRAAPSASALRRSSGISFRL